MNEIQVLFNSGSKINPITPIYVVKLGFSIWKTSVRAPKVDGSSLKTYGILSAKFLIYDSIKKVRFFKKTFLLANITIEVVLGIPFFSLSNIDIKFAKILKNLSGNLTLL